MSRQTGTTSLVVHHLYRPTFCCPLITSPARIVCCCRPNRAYCSQRSSAKVDHRVALGSWRASGHPVTAAAVWGWWLPNVKQIFLPLTSNNRMDTIARIRLQLIRDGLVSVEMNASGWDPFNPLAGPILQRGRIACNAERCNTYSNSVCLSVRLSHAGTLSRRMNIGSRSLHCEIAKTL